MCTCGAFTRTLVMEACDQATITGANFLHLKGIFALGMHGCSDEQVATARGLGLQLHTNYCTLSGGPFHVKW